MRKYVLIFVYVFAFGLMASTANGTTKRNVAAPRSNDTDNTELTFFGQVVGGYKDGLKPEYLFESGLDYSWHDGRLGGFAFFSVEESTSTALGGGTINLFPWLQIGVGAGYDQEPKSLVGAGMAMIHGCHWEIRGYGWVGENDFRRYWIEGMIDTDYHVVFGGTFNNEDGGGPYIGFKIPDTPVEGRIGMTWLTPFYDNEGRGDEKENADETWRATLRINLP